MSCGDFYRKSIPDSFWFSANVSPNPKARAKVMGLKNRKLNALWDNIIKRCDKAIYSGIILPFGIRLAVAPKHRQALPPAHSPSGLSVWEGCVPDTGCEQVWHRSRWPRWRAAVL